MVQAGRVHGGHGQVEPVDTVPVLEVGHRGLGAAAGGEGWEGQLVVRGQPGDNTGTELYGAENWSEHYMYVLN